MPVARSLRVASAGGAVALPPSATSTYMAWNQGSASTGFLGAYKMNSDGFTVDASYSGYGLGGSGTAIAHTAWSRGATWLAATRTDNRIYTYPFTGSGFGSGSSMGLVSAAGNPPARGASFAIAPQNDRIVAFNADGYSGMYSVNPATGAFLAFDPNTFGWVEPQKLMYQVAWSPTADVFVATQYSAPYVTMWLTTGTTVTGRSITNWGSGSLMNPAGAAWSADGNVCFLYSGTNIYAVTRSGSTFTANTTPAAASVSTYPAQGLAMSPDGKLLAALSSGGLDVSVYSVNGTALTRILEAGSGGSACGGIAWSPDGQKLYALYYYSAFSAMGAAMWARSGTTGMSTQRWDLIFSGSGNFSYNTTNALSIAP